MRSVTEELLKANEIIGKLQDQLKQEQNKSKLRGRIAAEQEKLLSDKDKDLQGKKISKQDLLFLLFSRIEYSRLYLIKAG